MFRRDFIQRIAVAGASGLAVADAMPTTTTVKYKVTGFSCAACAVGLEVMLRELKGVVRAKASYQDAMAVICFDTNVLSDAALKDFITAQGFTVQETR